MASEVDRSLLEKAADMTASALRGQMGGQGSQPPSYAAELFREIWSALKEGSQDLSGRPSAGF